MHWSGKIEELITELEGYRGDATLLNETWRHEQTELWETCHKHIFMGAGKYDNKHEVWIIFNKIWRKRIIDIEYINERVITTTILISRQHIKLMSMYFPDSKYADHHIEKMYKTIEKHMLNNKKNTFQSLEKTSILSWDMQKERNVRVLASTLQTKVTREKTEWKAGWLMLNDYSAVNTMFRKTSYKQTSFVSLQKEKKNKLITFRAREDTWEMSRTLRPTTWSTWIVTIDVSWLLSWSTRPGRTSMSGKKKNMRRLDMLNTSKKERISILKCPSSKKDIKNSLKQ